MKTAIHLLTRYLETTEILSSEPHARAISSINNLASADPVRSTDPKKGLLAGSDKGSGSSNVGPLQTETTNENSSASSSCKIDPEYEI